VRKILFDGTIVSVKDSVGHKKIFVTGVDQGWPVKRDWFGVKTAGKAPELVALLRAGAAFQIVSADQGLEMLVEGKLISVIRQSGS
jgi:hypothetical protein